MSRFMRPVMLAMAVAVLAVLLLATTGFVAVVPALATSACPPGKPGGPPPAQPNYPLGQCQLVLSSTVVPAGNSVTVSGSGFAADSQVVIAIVPPGTVLATAMTNLAGSLDQTVTIPPSTPPGRYTLTATGKDPSGQLLELGTSFAVLPARAAASLGPAPGAKGGTSTPPASGAPPRQQTPPPTSPRRHAPVRHGPPSSPNPALASVGLAALGLLVVLAGTGVVLLWWRRRNPDDDSQGAPR